MAVLLGIAPASAPSPVGSARAIVELHWAAVEGCPSEEHARARVETFLGGPLDRARATRLEIDVAITRERDAFVARIDTRTDEGPRRRHLPAHRDCALVGEAAALVVAMAIDPDVVTQLGDEQLRALQLGQAGRESDMAPVDPPTDALPPEPTPPVEPERPPAAAQRPPAAPRVPTRARPFALARATFDAGWGRLPGVDLGTSLALGIGWTRLRAEVLGVFVAPRRVTIEDGDARFLAWAVGARIGATAIDRPRIELPLLAGIDVGQIRARGVGLPDTRSADPVVVYARLGPGLRVRVHPLLAIAFELDLLVPFTRPSFSVQGHGQVFRLPPVAVRGAVGIELRWPGRPGPRSRARVAMDRPGSGNKACRLADIVDDTGRTPRGADRRRRACLRRARHRDRLSGSS